MPRGRNAAVIGTSEAVGGTLALGTVKGVLILSKTQSKLTTTLKMTKCIIFLRIFYKKCSHLGLRNHYLLETQKKNN